MQSARQGAGRPPDPPRFYNVAQVAEILGMSTMTVYRAIGAGEFPAVRIRGRLTIPAQVIESMAALAIAENAVVDAAKWVRNGSTHRSGPV